MIGDRCCDKALLPRPLHIGPATKTGELLASVLYEMLAGQPPTAAGRRSRSS